MTKTQKAEYDKLLDWWEGDDEWGEPNEDKYRLLVESDDGKFTLPALRRAKEVQDEIDAALEEAAKRIRALEKRNVGVGDTTTDEEIANVFFGLLH